MMNVIHTEYSNKRTRTILHNDFFNISNCNFYNVLTAFLSFMTALNYFSPFMFCTEEFSAEKTEKNNCADL